VCYGRGSVWPGGNTDSLSHQLKKEENMSAQIVVHYFRPLGDYGTIADTNSGWNLWLWSVTTGAPGSAYAFQGIDPTIGDFGAYGTYQIPDGTSRVGIIVRKGDWQERDIDEDRFVYLTGGTTEIWLIQADPIVYTDRAWAVLARDAELDASEPAFGGVFLDTPTVIHATYCVGNSYAVPVDLTREDGSFNFSVFDETDGETIRAVSVPTPPPADPIVYEITLEREPDVTHILTLTYTSNGDQIGPGSVQKTGASKMIIPRLVLDHPKYFYNGDDLGATHTAAATSFRVWAPTASDVRVRIVDEHTGGELDSRQMNSHLDGTWTVDMEGDRNNQYYVYEVTCQGVTRIAVDPYARNTNPNGTCGQIVDLGATDPEEWTTDAQFARPDNFKGPLDAVIYEAHVRDFSIAGTWDMANRGKYLAFTEPSAQGSVAFAPAYLHDLDVTHLELLPIAGCGTLDEIRGGCADPAPVGDGSRYNWCYDPRDYNVPNGAYATTPEGTVRITEVKQMVQALHSKNIGVIMDVVYAHVWNTDRFDNIVPQYFFRTDDNGNYTNGSYVGNEIAAERQMVCKFIVDSLSYWMKEYHIDGFRFDQMYLLGAATVLVLKTAISAANPLAVMLGEAWNTDKSGLPSSHQFSLQNGAQRGTRIAVFNNDVNNAVVGNALGGTEPGYVTSEGSVGRITVVRAIAGDTCFNNTAFGTMANPDETINYVSCHDNFTLWDHVRLCTSKLAVTDDRWTDDAWRDGTWRKMVKLALTIVLTCQGIPFLQGGDEFLRTKGKENLFISGNSDTAGDVVNQFDWSRIGTYVDVHDYCKGMVQLRRTHPAFRIRKPSKIRKRLRFLSVPDGRSINFQLIEGIKNGDVWDTIQVILNPTANPVEIAATGAWKIVVQDGVVDLSGGMGGPAGGKVTVAPYCATIMHSGDVSNDIDPTVGIAQ
jgi:pullulanase